MSSKAKLERRLRKAITQTAKLHALGVEVEPRPWMALDVLGLMKDPRRDAELADSTWHARIADLEGIVVAA